MKKLYIRIVLFLIFLIMIIFVILNQDEVKRQVNIFGTFSRTFTSSSAPGLTQETSGSVERISLGNGGWIVTAGGVPANTHYARLRYKIPENEGMLFTYFYTKTTVILPSDFYVKQKASFRILNTDNFRTILNGIPVGSLGVNELRVSVYFGSDQKVKLQIKHEGMTIETLYNATSLLPVGKHTFELAGDVANVAPWYFKIDGVTVASGVRRLSTDDTALSERVVTRIGTGIDGAADQDSNSMSLTVTEFIVANYDANVSSVSPTPSVVVNTTIPSSATSTIDFTMTPTMTFTSTPTITATKTNTATFTKTPTSTPTVICVQALNVWVCDKKP